MAYKTMDEYIDASSENVKEILQKVRQTIKSVIPDATETIGYGVPSFDMLGKHIIMFAGFKNHIGIYPTPAVIKKFKSELTSYKTAEGTIQFQLNEPIPYDLIKKIVEYRVKQTGQ